VQDTGNQCGIILSGVLEIAGQQGRCVVGHRFAPPGIEGGLRYLAPRVLLWRFRCPARIPVTACLTLKDRRKRGSDAPSRKKPQDRDEQSQRQTGRRHENVDTENVENDGAQDRKRQRNVPICQKKQRGHDLQQEKHDIQARYENRAQELPGNPGRRWQGNEVQKPVEPECQEDNAKQITRDRRNTFHAPSSSTNKIDLIDISSIDIDISDIEYNGAIQNFMENRKRPPNALHTWLIMLKSWQSVSRWVVNDTKQCTV